jgi:hypothetical protein
MKESKHKNVEPMFWLAAKYPLLTETLRERLGFVRSQLGALAFAAYFPLFGWQILINFV